MIRHDTKWTDVSVITAWFSMHVDKFKDPRPITVFWQLVCFLSCILSLLPLITHAAQHKPVSNVPAYDIRIVVDISGSMKQNDPQNLRAPAVRLLADLLPQSAHAGVWTFGKYVNMLVPLGQVNPQWRTNAKNLSTAINSVALRTNIPDALKRASQGWSEPSTTQRSLILLTDGWIDISPKPIENHDAKQHLLANILPLLQNNQIQIHTIAMSPEVDHDLLEHLAVATQGSYSKAYQTSDLLPVLASVFDKTVPQQQLPIEDNRFYVDSGIDEFTALIFHNNPIQLKLIDPNQRVYLPEHSEVEWVKESSFDLITMTNPISGDWTLQGELGPDSRVTIVSDLALKVDNLPHQIFYGEFIEPNIYLTDKGKPIISEDFLGILNINLIQQHIDSQQQWVEPLTQYSTQNIYIPDDGYYSKKLVDNLLPGEHKITITVDGATFKRQYNHYINVLSDLIEHRIITENDETTVFVTINASRLQASSLELAAELTLSDMHHSTLNIVTIDPTSFEIPITATAKAGLYQLHVKLKANTIAGMPLTIESDPIDIELETGFSADTDMNLEEEYDGEEAFQVEIDDATTEPYIPDESSTEGSAASLTHFVLIGLGIILNLLLISAGYIIYRKATGQLKQDMQTILNGEASNPSDLAENTTFDASLDLSEPEPDLNKRAN